MVQTRTVKTTESSTNTDGPMYAKGTYKKRKTAPKGAALVRKVIMSIAEDKRFAAGDAVSLMNHATFRGWNPLYWITQGTAPNQRIGDSIYIQNIECLFVINTNRAGIFVDDNSVFFALVQADRLQNQDGTFGPSSAGFTFPDMRLSAVGAVSNPSVDERSYKVIWSTRFKLINQGLSKITTTTATSDTFNTDFADQHYCIRKTIKLNRKFTYDSGTGGYAAKNNFYFVCGYNNQSANSMCEASLQYVVNYKDI